MRETGSMSPRKGSSEEHTITLAGTEEEISHIRAMMNGTIWISYPGTKMATQDRFKPTPDPIDDPMVPPQWQSDIGIGNIPSRFAPQIREMSPLAEEGWHMPSFYMSHIFNPKENIPKLQNWGFECMRSRRGEDGKFWEVWYLPGEWAAKGELHEFINGIPEKNANHLAPDHCLECRHDKRNTPYQEMDWRMSLNYCWKHQMCPYGRCEDFESYNLKCLPWSKRTEKVCRWLAQRVCFGTLNVAVQRMALANPD